jgi:hypothetical protein
VDGKLEAVERKIFAFERAEAQRSALLLVHDVVHGVKLRDKTLNQAFAGLYEHGLKWIVDDPVKLDRFATALGTNREVLVAMWEMGDQRDRIRPWRVRTVDDTEFLLECTRSKIDDLPEYYLEAATLAVTMNEAIVNQHESIFNCFDTPGRSIPVSGCSAFNQDFDVIRTDGFV